MKRFFTLLPIIFLFFSFSTMSGIDEVVIAMKAGNVSKLARFFDNSVEVSMPDKSNSYSKSQAEMVLKDFFSTYNVKSFDIISEGENAGSQYCIGTLQTNNGTFRTTIFMQQKQGAQVLQELRFENR
jgi:hypothetical protein